jgi:hypothetical protein
LYSSTVVILFNNEQNAEVPIAIRSDATEVS